LSSSPAFFLLYLKIIFCLRSHFVLSFVFFLPALLLAVHLVSLQFPSSWMRLLNSFSPACVLAGLESVFFFSAASSANSKPRNPLIQRLFQICRGPGVVMVAFLPYPFQKDSPPTQTPPSSPFLFALTGTRDYFLSSVEALFRILSPCLAFVRSVFFDASSLKFFRTLPPLSPSDNTPFCCLVAAHWTHEC